MVKEVMTVLGPVASEDLGLVSMHEHILVDSRIWRRKFESLIPDDLPVSGDDAISLENIGLLRRNMFLVADNMVLDDEGLMTAELAEFRASGGGAVVEMSSVGLRLNLPAIQRISRKTGVHIVATTGLYLEDSWPEHIREMTIEQLTELMVKEIEEGIEDTGIKAGHIGELGISSLGQREVGLLRAGARASIETGLSVTVHQETSQAHGRRVVDILTEEGMDPERIIMGHTDEFLVEHEARVLVKNPDTWGLCLDYHKELLDRGVNIAFDCFGHWFDEELRGVVFTTDWQRIAGLLALIDAGYASQIVLGTDMFLKMLLRRCGGEGYCRLTNYVLPTLKAHGAPDYDIRLMTIENPARLLVR